MPDTTGELPPLRGPLEVLGSADRRDLTRLGSWSAFEPGSMLLRQGGASGSLFVLTSGTARVVMSTPAGDELLVAVLGAGDTVGELSVLDGEPRSASVWAIERVRALQVDGPAFGRFLLTRPAVTVGMLRILSQRLRAADRLRLHAALAPTDQRLAWCLLSLAGEHGEVDGHEVRITAPLSQADLASFVGASREAVNQALGRLRADGVVRTARRSTTIVDLDELRRRAGA